MSGEMLTEVCGRMVPVADGPRSIVAFEQGEKPGDVAGRYAFWTALFKTADGREGGHVGRALEPSEPGERFNRHPDDSAYDAMRTDLQWCTGVEPSTVAHIEHWLRTHQKDARHALEAEVGGKKYRVEQLRLIPAD